MRTSWFGGLVRGSREGARAHTRARRHARTETRAHTLVHTHACTRGRGSPRRAGQGPQNAPHPCGDGTCGLGRGPRGSYRGHKRRCRVPGAPQVLVFGGPGPDRAARRRLRGDRARHLHRHFIPGLARGAGGPRWVGMRETGGRRGRRCPGPTCARPAGRSGGEARGPGHALLPPSSQAAAPQGGRWGTVTGH